MKKRYSIPIITASALIVVALGLLAVAQTDTNLGWKTELLIRSVLVDESELFKLQSGCPAC